ncbi:MAG: DEAD/DEAH box helicase [Nitrososphaeraceae archaeon]
MPFYPRTDRIDNIFEFDRGTVFLIYHNMADLKPSTTGDALDKIATPEPKQKNPTLAISSLRFPFKLTKDQLEAVDKWVSNGYNGSIIYSTGTGKTEIAFECAKRAAALTLAKNSSVSEDTQLQKTSCRRGNSFNILFLVPRIVLVEQNINRLTKYGVPKDHIGAYFGERKEPREITVSTYQSASNNPHLIRNSNMIVFDEVHLATDTATTLSTIFDALKAVESPKKLLLGLTATIDEQDPRYKTILSLMPPVKKYMIKEAVKDKRLAKPVVIPMQVKLEYHEKKKYIEYSQKIKNISGYLNSSDPKSISSLLRKGGHSAGLARAWFANVKDRKNLLSCAKNKLLAATELITKKHPSERIMVFSETIESIQRLQEMLQNSGTRSEIIHAKLKSKQRQKILTEWGKEFFALLSVHTLEIGYDVPEVRVAIILASTSNMNQIVQRIGRIIRIYEGKETALIYSVYLSDTSDIGTLKRLKKATDTDQKDISNKEGSNTDGGRKSQMNRNLDEYIF